MNGHDDETERQRKDQFEDAKALLGGVLLAGTIVMFLAITAWRIIR